MAAKSLTEGLECQLEWPRRRSMKANHESAVEIVPLGKAMQLVLGSRDEHTQGLTQGPSPAPSAASE